MPLRPTRRPGGVRAAAALAALVLLVAPALSACGKSHAGTASGASGKTASGTVEPESYRLAFCQARTSFHNLTASMASRAAAPLNKADLQADKQARLALVDDMEKGAEQIVTSLTAAGVPDVQGGQSGAQVTLEVYQDLVKAFGAVRTDFAGTSTSKEPAYALALGRLQHALIDAANGLGTQVAAKAGEIDPAFNAILHCP